MYESKLRPAAEYDGAGNLLARYIYGTKINVPEYIVKNGETYRIITDHLGSVRFVVEAATGTVVQSIVYDEYGIVESDNDPGFTPFGFAGGMYDHETGLVRFGFRDYDANCGKWTCKDPIGVEGGFNFYVYCENNPINVNDALGLYPPSHPYCKALRQKIDNIKKEISKRIGQFHEDPQNLPWTVAGDKEMPSKSKKGHVRLLNEHKTNLAVRQAEYMVMCNDDEGGGGCPPSTPSPEVMGAAAMLLMLMLLLAPLGI